MAEEIGEGGIRVRFGWDRTGASTPNDAARALHPLLAALDAAGLSPTLDDGLVAGNAAVRDSHGLWVSPSGRAPALEARAHTKLGPEQMVHVSEFSAESWAARGRGPVAAKPTSDTPLHWAALMQAPLKFGWAQQPTVALHGHALAQGDEAVRLNIPCSPRETLFSTPADRAALLELLGEHPYPRTQVWVRRGHGFFLLAQDPSAALRALEALQQQIATLRSPSH